ncbi:MAG: outer membrane beta-barrel protein [Bacteroidota bacterium]
MKTKIIILSALLMSFSIAAQEEESKQDTTRISYKGKVITIHNNGDTIEVKDEEEWDVNHWRGLEFGINGYSTSKDFEINNDPNNVFLELDYAKSFMINLNIAEFNQKLGNEHFRFMTGLGFRFNRYAFKSTKSTLSYNDTTIFSATDSTKSFDKNFLNATYLSVPAYFTFMPGNDPDKSFHISIGALLNYRIGSRVKQKFSQNDQNRKDINRGHYHISPFLVDASVRIGAGRFTAFANYALTPLFEKNKGPEYYPFSAGLSLNF